MPTWTDDMPLYLKKDAEEEMLRGNNILYNIKFSFHDIFAILVLKILRLSA